jgi:hypothetical protein
MIRHFEKNLGIAISIIICSLLMGMMGYHYLESLSWLDSYLNASMILAGMGPVAELKTNAGKFFAGSYALFSGIIFLVAIALVLAPALHHYLHKLHMAEEKEKENK